MRPSYLYICATRDSEGEIHARCATPPGRTARVGGPRPALGTNGAVGTRCHGAVPGGAEHGGGLDPSTTQTLWIMDAYGFFIAGFLITMGTLGDRIGRRRLLMIGMTAFALASIFAALAPNAELLILARALLGIAGATLMPSTLSLISNMFADARQRALAIGVWATMFAVGMAAGPVAGGAMVDALWWGAAFLLAVPAAVLVLLGARRVLPEYADPAAGRLDLASVALSLAPSFR
ncbi:MFS transporter [Sanguibacter sp. Z1732]|uniref:MFS transporter n=1 Tax=Sanguibacter sp. Z1732 TaxID=3435412 RepID=UPI003D9C8D74